MDKIQPFSYLSGRDTFSRVREHLGGLMVNYSHKVHTEEWQGRDISDKPEMLSHELMNVTFTHPLNGENLQTYRDDVKPNLPWADDHFEERVCGKPINPGVEWANWPWGNSADSFRDETGKFGHNYVERYWPRFAGNEPDNRGRYDSQGASPNAGIRNYYGDMNDLVRSLAAKPTSRQEWFPIFYPEDVGETVDGRKPCSLGYQFWVRGGQLHVYYPLRSCDYMHHMQDDIYLTIRLLLWVLDRCREIDSSWNAVTPGLFTMHCTSLHIFANDMIKLRNA